MKKNMFLTFCFSFIPGAGQMYQKYMKRGLSIMIIFFLFVMLAVITSTPVFAIPCFIIWAYGFFDTFHIRNSFDNKDNEEKNSDAFVWGDNDSIKNLLSKKSYFIGIGLILIGVYVLLNNIFYTLADSLNIDWLYTLISCFRKYLPNLIIAALSIGIGIKLMFNKKA